MVLVVIDDSELRENVVELLELQNYEVWVGESLLQKLGELDTELTKLIVFGDVKDNQQELAKNVRTSSLSRDVPMLFLTHDDRSEPEKNIYLNKQAYLQMPFEANQLLKCVEDLLLNIRG